MITAAKINEYLETLIPERTKLLSRMEDEAARERIPIIQLPSMQLIHFLLQMHRPKKILEVGMAIGYSTIRFAQSAPDAHITSIEISEEMVERAARNFAEAGLADRITVLHQDAREGLEGNQTFDCIFIDAAKGQYQVFFEQYYPLLREGGLLICDNVLYQGMVAEEELPRKKRAMITKLQVFNRFLASHPSLDTTFVPVGDGLALCLKRGE
ncbi:O-methyltransferase [Aneurinibacillus sp. Ricciae_BoGa-3]|uniref:O-methyltransferase n=1 Tax=Aneurinibacillus sp. Ricciae_BoGa-3 TaxID=3022697 RepID=UPI002341F9F9|nr:O-methyltransferase [Aneurinibacillus sp. Ricciae_BoGa-3]WCK53586.1 O-methyltransferase [Aneurinibacillus sp. Ricciae_BoGa-3]